MKCPSCNAAELNDVMYQNRSLGFVCKDGCKKYFYEDWRPNFESGEVEILLVEGGTDTQRSHVVERIPF